MRISRISLLSVSGYCRGTHEIGTLEVNLIVANMVDVRPISLTVFARH
jgi:hypothetical protein